MRRTFCVAGAITVFLLASAGSETLAPDVEAIAAAVDGFHNALHRGDAKAAMELLAPDAVILESGSAETRQDYEKHHLAEDIAFSRAVKITSSTPSVRVEGNTAWVFSTNKVTGTFNGRPVNSAGAELMVLTNSAVGWRIRAVHWSNHTIKKGD